jgi:hypothetical protein
VRRREDAPVGTARECSSSAVCARVRCCPSAVEPVGERKKSRDQDFVLVLEFDVCVVGVAVALACCRSWRVRDCWRVSFVPDAGVMIS